MRNNSFKATKGFTLLEILVALFIFTLISVIVVSALHSVFNSQAATEKKTARLAALQLALLIFSRDLEQVVNRPIIDANDTPQNPFIGTSTALTFTHGGWANPFGRLQQSTLQRTAYIINANKLIRRIWPVLDQTTDTVPEERILLDSVQEMTFEYLDDQGHFQNNWPLSGKSVLFPRGVRITLLLSKWGKISQFYVIPIQPPPNKSAQDK